MHNPEIDLSQLKPCPLCRGEAEFEHIRTAIISCKSCNLKLEKSISIYLNYQMNRRAEALVAFQAWQLREHLPPSPSVLEWEEVDEGYHVCEAPLFGRLRIEPCHGDQSGFHVNWSAPGISDRLFEDPFPTVQDAKQHVHDHLSAWASQLISKPDFQRKPL